VPVDEALRRSSVEEEADDGEAVKRAGGPPSRGAVDGDTDRGLADDARPARDSGAEPGEMAMADEIAPRRIRRTAGSPVAARRDATPAASKPAEAACRLDAGHRRVVELRLPGLDGTTVSLGDIDADLVLLDFWGSWCRECRTSIDHHREIQGQLGGKTLQVIGIACEKGASFEARRDAAAAAARKHGINYPVLVTSMDGACPVQKALRVQFYPSMVLLDHEGNILQFEQGATDATLGRIDRAIAKAVHDRD
jgi:peroxiredoxin